MPTYVIREKTFVSHLGRTYHPGETVTINWPPGTEPKKLGNNMEQVKGAKADKAEQKDPPEA